MEQVNVTANGAYVFAGVNSDAKPLEDYLSKPAFGCTIGRGERIHDGNSAFAPGDPAAANIDPKRHGPRF